MAVDVKNLFSKTARSDWSGLLRIPDNELPAVGIARGVCISNNQCIDLWLESSTVNAGLELGRDADSFFIFLPLAPETNSTIRDATPSSNKAAPGLTTA